jgi:DNA polymerase I
MADTSATPDLPAPIPLPEPGAEGVLYAIDISGYVFRAFHALPPLTNEHGEPTGALYGVTSMILKLVREQRPHMLAVVMDSRLPSFRKELYGEYKSNRPAAPDDLKRQMAHVRDVADAYAIPCYEVDGAEADDLIASLVQTARERGHRVVIVSADKDLLQLVGPGVWMLDTMKGRGYDARGTVEKLGVLPERVGDYLALVGDSSDNVPGVPSVGPKTAVELLREFGSLDGIYAGLAGLKKKALKQKLEDARDLAYLSRTLVALKTDFALPYDEAALVYGGFDAEALRVFYKRWGFTRLLAQLGEPAQPAGAEGTAAPAVASPAPSAPPSAVARAPAPDIRPARVIADAVSLGAFVAELGDGALLIGAIADGGDGVSGRIAGVGLATEAALGYVTLKQEDGLFGEGVTAAELSAALGPLLGRADVPKRMGDAKRDIAALSRLGVHLEGVTFDSMLASYLLDPDVRGHTVAANAVRRYGFELPTVEALIGSGKGKRAFVDLAAAELAAVSAAELSVLPGLCDALASELAEAQLAGLLSDLEVPLARVLARVELTGVRCDAALLEQLSRRADVELSALEKRCYELAGGEFNVGSPRQLETILFDKLGLPVIERTKTSRSTNHEVLEELALLNPLPQVILEHRQLAKLKGTYLDALPREIRAHTGRIHTRFEQAVAATGRLSSNEPNLQNIPIRSELGREIRRAFVAEPGYRIMSADYSQIELRVLAHLSGDEALCSAFSEDRDVHVLTAQALFEVDAAGVTRDMRAAAKTVNFAVIYGQTQFALARNLRIARGEAARYIKAFFERYSGVRRYLDALVEEARATGAVRTLLGRRRLVRDIHAKNHAVRGGAERIAQNAPIQGSAADIMKLAMVRAQSALEASGLGARMILTVHDELVLEVRAGEEEAAEALIRQAMEGAVSLRVPLVVGVGVGDNWGDAH